jgi:lysozyme
MSFSRGFDVSAAQGDLTHQWPLIKAAGVDFVMVKAGDGNNQPDKYYKANITGARAAGILVGAYHVIFPLAHIDPVHQAEIHFALTDRQDLPHAMDYEWPTRPFWAKWETNTQQMNDWAAAYADRLSVLQGCQTLIYSFPDFWFSGADGVHADQDGRFGRHLLWAADYKYQGVVPPDGASPRDWAPFSGWTLWQHSGDPIQGKCMRLPNGAPVDGIVASDLDALVRLAAGVAVSS